MHSAVRRTGVVVAAVVFSACSTNLDIPDNVIVSCEKPSDCPPGYHCTNGHICVPSTKDDSVAPTVSDPAFDNPHVKPGATATLTFTVSEPLLIDPVLTFATGSSTYTLTRTAFDEAALSYAFAYTSSGDEVEGQAVVSAALLDRAGNSNVESLPVIYIDRTAPSVTTATLQLLPNLQTNPLPTVTAITNTTRVRFTFTASEQLGEAPPLFVDEHQVIVMNIVAPASDLAPSADFIWDASFGVADGSHVPNVLLTDLAGNSATVPADTIHFNVDTVAPSPVAVSTPGAVVLQREPWGHSGDVHQQSKVVGAAGAAEAGTTVLAYDTATLPACPVNGCKFWAQSRASTQSGTDGSFLLDFGGLDRTTVYIAVADAAGNVSNRASLDVPLAPLVVRDTQLTVITALGADTVPQSGNAMLAVSELEHMLPGLRSIKIPRDDTSAEDGTVFTTAGASAWKDVAPSTTPGSSDGRYQSFGNEAVGYLPTRGQLVLFGGGTITTAPDTLTYVRDSVNFEPIATSLPPPARRGARFAYDPVNDGLLLMGGDNIVNSGDMWFWDGDDWVEICTTDACHNGPHTENYAGVSATDPNRRVVVFFSATTGMIWEWDGASWTQTCDATCAAAGPTPGQYGAAFDPYTSTILAFGGPDNRTWSWDGTTWTQQCTSSACMASLPTTRQNPELAYDVARNNVVLFGGVILSDPSIHPPTETWVWNGSTWTLVNTLDSVAHRSRFHHRLVYDGRRQVVASLGGTVVAGSAGLLDGSLEWDGAKWRELTQNNAVSTPTAPSAAAGITYEPQSKYVIASDGNASFEFDGYQWFKSSIANTPSAAGATQMATPATATAGARTPIMLTGSTVTYKLVSGAWQSVCSGCGLTAVGPMGSDGTGVILGSQGSAHDVYRWNGSAWSTACNGCETHFVSAGFSYNGQAGQVISLGPAGSGNPRETFSAGAWTVNEASSSATPTGYGLVWDVLRGRAIGMPGHRAGPSGTQTFAFLWGDSAAPPLATTSTGAPTFDSVVNATFDEVRNEAVAISSNGNTFVFRSGGATRPAHLFEIGLLGLVDAAQIELSAIDVTWKGSAASMKAGVASTGIAFWVWSYDHWEPVPATQVDTDHWSAHITDSALAVYRKTNSLIFGPNSTIIVAASPDGTTGTGASFATITTDFAQAQITYRHK